MILPIKLWESTTERDFIKQFRMLVGVNEKETPHEPDRGDGIVRYNIQPTTPGTKVVLNIFSGSSVYDQPSDWVSQDFEIASDGRLMPAEDPRYGRHLHPRLSLASQSSEGGAYPLLTADFTFVEVSRAVRDTMQTQFDAEYNPQKAEFDKDDPHHGCALHVLELTSSSVPKTWMVLLPECLDTTLNGKIRPPRQGHEDRPDRTLGRFDILVFYRPALRKPGQDKMMDTYTKTQNVPISNHRLGRYIIDPPSTSPFFVESPAPPASAGKPGSQPQERWARWEATPNNGFEQQLTQSGKKVMIVYPWPSGGDFGVAITNQLSSLLQKLLIALQSADSIAFACQQAVQLSSIAIGGFSLGVGEAIKAWKQNSNRIDELYLFDPPIDAVKTLGDQESEHLKQWLNTSLSSRKKKKMRMIGGTSHKELLTIKNMLKPTDTSPVDVWVRPQEPDFWKGNGANEYYSRALLPPALPSDLTKADDPTSYKVPPERFDDVKDKDAPKGSLSKDSWLFIKDEMGMDAVILEAWELKVGGTRIGTLSLPLTHAEAAGFVRSHWLMELDKDKKHIGGALKTTQDLAMLEQEVRNRVFTAGYNNIRHQWTLIGGEKDASRQKHFEGYLYQCLRDSNFESR